MNGNNDHTYTELAEERNRGLVHIYSCMFRAQSYASLPGNIHICNLRIIGKWVFLIAILDSTYCQKKKATFSTHTSQYRQISSAAAEN